ncbi:MAG: hypothetical protein ABJG78_19135 [Cyclobacteriaceae bacterium]
MKRATNLITSSSNLFYRPVVQSEATKLGSPHFCLEGHMIFALVVLIQLAYFRVIELHVACSSFLYFPEENDSKYCFDAGKSASRKLSILLKII